MTDTPQLLLGHHLKALKLRTFLREYEKLARQCAAGVSIMSAFSCASSSGALLDRLTHHVHILEMNGDSYRLNQSKRRSRRNNADTRKDDLTPT